MKILNRLILPLAMLAAQPVMAIEQREAQGVAYVSGGAGQEEQDAMQALRDSYNLHLTLTQGARGTYVADVHVRIYPVDHPERGLDVKTEGPMFYARLTPGKYVLSATYQDKSQERPLTIPERGEVSLTLQWPTTDVDVKRTAE